MKKSRTVKTIILLFLMVLVPVLLLAGLGQRMQKQEAEVLEMNFQKLISAQLQNIDDQFQGYFASLHEQLISQFSAGSAGRDITNIEFLKYVLSENPYLRNIYIAESSGQRLYPVPGSESQQEKAFLQKTVLLWQDIESFRHHAEDKVSAKQNRLYFPSLKSTSSYQSEASVAESAMDLEEAAGSRLLITDKGWKVWYTESNLSFIFWFRDQSDRLIACELFSSRIVSDLINSLPDTSPDNGDTNSTIQLLNEKGEVTYQWGNYLSALQDPNSVKADLGIYLSHPLGGWRLDYYSDGLQQGQAEQLNFMLALAAIALTLTGLAIFLYREQRREFNLAQQRVSFVNQVSHELKTPLTNIRMYAELLDGKIDEDSGIRRYLTVITTESQRLSRLIENVLSYSRSQRSALTLNKQPGNIDALIESVITTFTPIMQSRGVELKFNGLASEAVYIDPEILEQILVNLLSNGEKYAAEGKCIEIESEIQGDDAVIRVRDYGPGIEKDEREKVFEAFYRVNSRLTEGVSGTGIGLGLSRELARLHGGDLCIVDEGRGTGCCFELSLNVMYTGDQP